jgi:hypothetical protein
MILSNDQIYNQAIKNDCRKLLDRGPPAWENSKTEDGKIMTYREDVLQQALALPPADRAFVAAALEESLSTAKPPLPADAVDAASPGAVSGSELLGELQRRSKAYKNGAMMARPAAEVLADLRRTSMGGQSK